MANSRLAPDIHVTVPNGPALLSSLNALAREQIPFAGSVTMKRMAELSVRRAHQEFPKRFTLRNKGLPRGITFFPKNGPPKKDWPHGKMQVVVSERSAFLADHEEPTIRRPRSGGRLAIPTMAVHKQRTKGGKLRKSVRPESLPDKFEQREALHSAQSKLPAGLTIFYLLRKQAKIRPRLHLREDVQETVGQTYDTIFAKELTAALRSRRTGSKSYSSKLGRMRYLRERTVVEGERWDRGAKMRT